MTNDNPNEYSLTDEDLDEVKAQTRRWAKRVGARLVHSTDDGNVEVWEYGKSQSRRRITQLYGSAIDSHFTGWKYNTYEQLAEETKSFAIRRLKEDFNIRDDLHLPISESGYSTLYYCLKDQYKEDDLPVLLARMITLADYSLDREKFSEEFRMTQALRLGHVIALYNQYLDSTERNSQNAANSKDPLGLKILKKLSKLDLPQVELWESFKSELRSADAEVIAQELNPKQPNTWSVSYEYQNEQGKEITNSMKYPSFKTRLSSLKNR
jgi:hypothetical protein